MKIEKPYPHLFQPLVVRGKKFRNRIISSPHNAAPNTDGVDMRSGVAVLTMKKSGASQSIISEPKAIATKDANGALSPITQPNVTDDPYGGYALGDVNRDNKVNATDALKILRYFAKKITSFD